METDARDRALRVFAAALRLDGRPDFPVSRLFTSRVRRDVHLRQRVLQALSDRGWSYNELSEVAGLSTSSVRIAITAFRRVDDDSERVALQATAEYKEAAPPLCEGAEVIDGAA